MGKIKDWLMGVVVHKYALGSLVSLWEKADGNRTQIQTFAAGVVVSLGFFGFIDFDKAITTAIFIGGSSSATFLEKLRKKKGLVKKIQKMVDEAKSDKE